jgi:hypothetical protein
MELFLKSNNEQSIAKIIALAKRLNVAVEEKVLNIDADSKKTLKNRVLNFKAKTPSSFGNIDKWQSEQREDRNLPFA